MTGSISSAASAATAGLGATASAAIGAAAAAASVSLITAATVAAGNAAVNDGNLSDVLDAIFDTITSSDTLRSAAISAVTAGAIAAIDAEFFQATQVAGADGATSGIVTQATDSAGQVTSSFAQSLSGQVFYQAAVNSAVTACLLYTSPSPRDLSTSRMPSSA